MLHNARTFISVNPSSLLSNLTLLGATVMWRAGVAPSAYSLSSAFWMSSRTKCSEPAYNSSASLFVERWETPRNSWNAERMSASRRLSSVSRPMPKRFRMYAHSSLHERSVPSAVLDGTTSATTSGATTTAAGSTTAATGSATSTAVDGFATGFSSSVVTTSAGGTTSTSSVDSGADFSTGTSSAAIGLSPSGFAGSAMTMGVEEAQPMTDLGFGFLRQCKRRVGERDSKALAEESTLWMQ